MTKYIGVQYDISIPFQKQVRNDFSVSDRSRRRISSTAFPVTLGHKAKKCLQSLPNIEIYSVGRLTKTLIIKVDRLKD